MTWLTDFIQKAGLLPAYLIITATVFAEDALFIGFILPGETVAILGGVLASRRHLELWLVISLVVLAAITGDSVGYQVGRHYGVRILELPLLRKRQTRIDEARALLARRGGAAVFLGRFTAFSVPSCPPCPACPGCPTAGFWPLTSPAARFGAPGRSSSDITPGMRTSVLRETSDLRWPYFSLPWPSQPWSPGTSPSAAKTGIKILLPRHSPDTPAGSPQADP